MNDFPVTNSTISAKHLGLFIQEKYGLSAEASCKLFRTGINHTYIVTDHNKKFVFRIYSYNWRSEMEIAEEIRLINLLKEDQVSVSYPIWDTDQNYIQKIPAPEGLRYGVLFSYAYGEKVRHFSKETSFNMGVLMASMHQVTENLKLKRIIYSVNTLIKQPYQFASEHFSENNEEMRFIRRAGDVITKVFGQAISDEIRKGVVHLDIWYDNMHVKNESEITIFDFDFCGNGWLLHDIAYFNMQMFHIEPDKQEYEAKLAAFLAGYETITKISAEEKQLIPYSGLGLWIFYLGVQSQRFDNWSNIFLSKNYLKRYIGMVKEWLNYHDIDICVANTMYEQ